MNDITPETFLQQDMQHSTSCCPIFHGHRFNKEEDCNHFFVKKKTTSNLIFIEKKAKLKLPNFLLFVNLFKNF
jgi:hypothetical protein